MSRLLSAFFIFLLISSCSSENTNPLELSGRPWIYSEDFIENTNLHAQDFQTLIVRVDDRITKSKVSYPNEQTVHTIPYYFDKDTDLKMTLDTKDPCIQSVRLSDYEGKGLLYIDLNNPSVSILIPQGSYRLTVKEIYPMPEHCSSSFIFNKTRDGQPSQIDTAQEAFDSGEGIFRAFRLLQWIDTLKRMEFYNDRGYLITLADTLKNQPISYPNLYVTRLATDITFMGKRNYPISSDDGSPPVKIGEPTNLMSLLPYNKEQQLYKIYSKALGKDFLYQSAIIAYSPGTGGKWHYGAGTGCWGEEGPTGGWAIGDVTIQQTFHRNSIYEQNYYRQDYYKERWTANVVSYNPYEFHIKYETGVFGGNSIALRNMDGSGGDNIILTSIFTQQCWGWMRGNYSYTMLLKEIYRLYDDASMLKNIGPRDVALYSGANYTGRAAVFNAESALPSVDFSDFTVKSIRVGHDATIKLFDNKGYKGNSAVVGIDIPDIYNDSRFKGLGAIRSLNVFKAVDIIISNDCPGCNLQDVNLSNQKFDKRDFRRTNFTRANLSGSSLTGAILVDAVLQNARLDNANLKGANMCRAMLNKDPLLQKAASLNGAYLQNVNLAFSEMSGASFVNSNFHSMTSKDSCIPDINCNTQNCSSAHKATMANSDFTGAYLNGTDMSNATLSAAKFTNAYAIGVNFSNSNLSSEPMTGQSGAVFVGAFLFGANFNNAKVQGVQFNNAYFDDQVVSPTIKGVAIAYLHEFYTTFPGSSFSKKPDDPRSYVCPQYTAPIVTTTAYLPTTDNTVTCPNRQSGPCYGDKWRAEIPFDSSRFAISYGGSYPYPAPSNCEGDRVYLLW